MKNKEYIYLDSKNHIELDAMQLCHLIEYGSSWNLEVDVPNQKKPILVSVKLKYDNGTPDKTEDKVSNFQNWFNYHFKNIIKG